MCVANSNGKGIGGIVRLRDLFQTQEELGHLLELDLLGPAIADKSLLDFQRRIFVKRNVVHGSAQDDDTACVAENESAPGVGSVKHTFYSHGFRSIGNLSMASGGRNRFNTFRHRDPATGEYSGEILALDFAANARSLGADAVVAPDAEGLERALAAARRSARTTVIVAEVDPTVEVPAYEAWWDVPIAEVSTSDSVRDARRAYVEHVEAERRFL